jgi:hypothetical protein
VDIVYYATRVGVDILISAILKKIEIIIFKFNKNNILP